MRNDRKEGFVLTLIHIKKAMPMLFLAVGIAFVCLVGGLVAKYVVSIPHGDNQIGANNFYFTLDLFDADEEFIGQDENRIVSRTVEFHGESQTALTFTVQNFMDELRISGKDIAYTLSWEGNISVAQGGNAVANGSGHTLTGGAQAAHAFTATLTDTTEEQTATVSIRSSSPYSKDLTLTIRFYPETYDVLYRVEDAPGNPYADLIVMVGKENGAAAEAINFDWSAASDGLQMDSTNTYIVRDYNGELIFPVPSGYTLPNTKAIGENGSISILFFKTDPSKNYAMPDTVAQLSAGIYQVVLGAETVQGGDGQ